MNDIDDILSEMFLPHPLIPPDEDDISYDWIIRDRMNKSNNTFDDSVVPVTVKQQNLMHSDTIYKTYENV
jgi:hypothetical protein